MHAPTARHRGLALIGLLAAAPLVLGIVGWRAGLPLGVDTAVYRAGALTLLHGDPLYDADTLALAPSWAALPFTYPPFAALVFVPLVVLPVAVAWGVFGALSVLALAVIIRLAIGDDTPAWARSPWLATAAAAVAAVFLEPVWRTISLGQVNLLLVAMVMVDVLVVSARGGRWGGVLIGVASAVKLTPLIFVAHLLFTGRRRDALRALATFAALQGLMVVLVPHDAVRYWGQAVSDPTRVGPIHWSVNQSLNALVLRITDGASWSMVVVAVIAVLLAAPAVSLMLRLHRSGRPVPALLVTAGYGLLISPVSWTHHFVWVVPLLVILACRAANRVDLAGVAGLVVVFGSYVLLLLPGGRDPGGGWSAVDHVLGNAYLIALLAVTVFAVRRVRRAY